MAVPSSGQVKLSQVASEFLDTAPYSMSEFYSVDDGVPASGQIKMTNFYGAAYVLGPYSFSIGSVEGTAVHVLATVNPTSANSITVSGNVFATNPVTAQIIVQRSSNSGGSWGADVVIASVTDTDFGNGTNTSSGTGTVSLSGYNAVRIAYKRINQHAWAGSGCSNVTATFA